MPLNVVVLIYLPLVSLGVLQSILQDSSQKKTVLKSSLQSPPTQRCVLGYECSLLQSVGPNFNQCRLHTQLTLRKDCICSST